VDKELLMAFADAIMNRKKVRVTFMTKDNRHLIRKCAPLDMAPSFRGKINYYKYHFWDFDSLPKPHLLSLSSEQIVRLDIIDEGFNPEEIVTWTRKYPWCIVRDWGSLS
jgi:hypothetical protein